MGEKANTSFKQLFFEKGERFVPKDDKQRPLVLDGPESFSVAGCAERKEVLTAGAEAQHPRLLSTRVVLDLEAGPCHNQGHRGLGAQNAQAEPAVDVDGPLVNERSHRAHLTSNEYFQGLVVWTARVQCRGPWSAGCRGLE